MKDLILINLGVIFCMIIILVVTDHFKVSFNNCSISFLLPLKPDLGSGFKISISSFYSIKGYSLLVGSCFCPTGFFQPPAAAAGREQLHWIQQELSESKAPRWMKWEYRIWVSSFEMAKCEMYTCLCVPRYVHACLHCFYTVFILTIYTYKIFNDLFLLENSTHRVNSKTLSNLCLASPLLALAVWKAGTVLLEGQKRLAEQLSQLQDCFLHRSPILGRSVVCSFRF